MTVELKIKFPVDDAALSLLHHRAFNPDRQIRTSSPARGRAGWSATA
jgi:hypothetical protein